MWNYLKKNYAVIILIVLSLAIGTFFIVLPGKDFIKIFSIILAIYLVIASGSLLTMAFSRPAANSFLKGRTAKIIGAALLVLLAVLTVLFPVYMVRIVIFLVMIVTPTVLLIVSPHKKIYLRDNFWKYIVGVIFILAVEVLVDIAFIILGIAFYVLAFFIIYLLIVNSRYQEKPSLVNKYLVRYFIFISHKKE
ncbi:MAG: hypothetical protein M0R05_02185 [Bacilli bacterium]|nr:hypothetical protein [Bacilli bacterium]MDD4077976.1 hypothetical protein [Bacilli bacterium]